MCHTVLENQIAFGTVDGPRCPGGRALKIRRRTERSSVKAPNIFRWPTKPGVPRAPSRRGGNGWLHNLPDPRLDRRGDGLTPPIPL